MTYQPNKIGFLPNYFQKIAAGLFVLSIIALFIMKSYFKLGDLSEQITGNIIMISFVIYMLAAQKIEDELTIKLRMRAWSVSFFAIISYAIIEPYINFLLGDGFVFDSSGKDVIQYGVIIYFK